MTITLDAPASTEADPRPLAAVLQGVADKLDGARFIGRHGGLVDTNEHDGSRWYHDPDDPTVRYQSVTFTISSTEAAPWLTDWAGKLAAEMVADHWAEIGEIASALGWPAAVAWMKREAKRQRALAADVGTWLHDVLEALLIGDVPIPDPLPDMLGRRLKTGGDDMVITQEVLDAWADGILTFIADYRLVPVMSEATVCNPLEGYAARVDLGAEFPGLGMGLVDMKSGWVRKSVMAQLTAQRYATEVWLPLGERIEMPRFEWTAALHLRPKWRAGYKLLPVPSGREQWEWFARANRLLQAREAQPDLDASALYPPVFGPDGAVTGYRKVPMVEDARVRCSGVLADAGFVWVEELTDWAAEDLLSDPKRGKGIKGLGAKGIDALRALLAEHGLTFAGESIEKIEKGVA